MDDDADEMKASLTSTMDNSPQNVLLSQNNDKNDANDSTPTSSTDAASIYSTRFVNALEDPISSTSSDVSEKNKVLVENIMDIMSGNVEVSKNLIGSDGDVDLLDMNITNVSSEPISEDVEDIVQDLENLLGESEPTKDYLTRRKQHHKKDVTDESDLVALENLVNEKERLDSPNLDSKEEHEDKNNSSRIVSGEDKSPPQLNSTEEPLEEFNPPKITKSDSDVCEEESEKLLEDAIKEPESSILQSDNDIRSGSSTNMDILVPEENEAKCKPEDFILPVEATDCAAKNSEKDCVTNEIGDGATDLSTEKVEAVTAGLNVSENQAFVEVEGGNEQKSFEEFPVPETSTQSDINMPSLDSKCDIYNSETKVSSVSDNKDKQTLNNEDTLESEISIPLPSLVSEDSTGLIVLTKPSSDDETGPPSHESVERDGGKTESQDAENEAIFEPNLSPEIPENILTEITYSATEESVDIDEIVKSAVDDVIEIDTPSTLVTKEQFDGGVISLPVENVDVLEDPVSVIDELLDDIKSGDTPKPEDFVEELFEAVVLETPGPLSKSVDLGCEESVEKISSHSEKDQGSFEKSTSFPEEIEHVRAPDSCSLDTILPIAKSSEQSVESTIEERKEVPPSLSEIATPASEDKSETVDVIPENIEPDIDSKELSEVFVETSSESILDIHSKELSEVFVEPSSIVKDISLDVSGSVLRDISNPTTEKLVAVTEDERELGLEDTTDTVTQNQPVVNDEVKPTTEPDLQTVATSNVEGNAESVMKDKADAVIESKTEKLTEDGTEMNMEDKVVDKGDESEEVIEDKIETSVKIDDEHILEDISEPFEVQTTAVEGNEPTIGDETELLVKEKSESDVEVETRLIITTETESIVNDAEIETVPIVDDENGPVVEEVQQPSKSVDNETKPVIEVGNEPIEKDESISVLDVECESIEEDVSASAIENVIGPNEEDVTEDVIEDKSGQSVKDVTETVVEVKKVQTVEEDTEPTIKYESESLGQDKIEISVESKTESAIEEVETESIIESTDELIVEEASKTIEENEIQSINQEETTLTVDDKPETVELEGSGGVVKDTSVTLAAEEPQQFVEELSETIPTAMTECIEEIFEPDTQKESYAAIKIEEPEKSLGADLKEHAESKSLQTGLVSDENREVAQVNEISSASVVKTFEISETDYSDDEKHKTEVPKGQKKSLGTSKELKLMREENEESDTPKEEASIKKENLIPVVEEFIEKKTIIYEHDCHQRKHVHHNEIKDQKVEDEIKENIMKQCHEGISKEAEVTNICDSVDARIEEIVINLIDDNSIDEPIISGLLEPSESKEGANKSESYSNLPEKDDSNHTFDLLEGDKDVGLSAETRKEHQADNADEITVKIDVKEDISGNNKFQENEISASTQIDEKKSEKKDYSKGIKDDPSVMCQNVEAESTVPNDVLKSSFPYMPSKKQVSKKQTDECSNSIITAIQDQTTAAVQSILDNMLAEEQSVELISDKDDHPVVHTSYSSYELQKAVQQIQDISKMDETEDITSEDVSYITEVEKPRETTEAVQMIEAESSGTNVEDSQEIPVQSIEPESTSVTCSVSEEKISLVVRDIESPQSSVTKMYVESKDDEAKRETLSSSEVATKQKDTPQMREFDQDAVKTVTSSQSLGKRVETALPNKRIVVIPMVEPSIDLSEESSNEECSEEENMNDKVSSTVPTIVSPKKPEADVEERGTRISIGKSVKGEVVTECVSVKSDVKKVIPRETRHSSRISERSRDKSQSSKENVNEPLTINIDETEKEKNCSPKVLTKIKEDELVDDREEHKGSLKITITKQSDNTHSILKICSPEAELRHKLSENDEGNVVPRLVIKTGESELHSPKMSTRSAKQTVSSNSNHKSCSPRITIKPIPKPESKESVTSPLKITIKPLGKPEEFSKQQQKHSPKLPKSKLEDDHYGTRSKVLKSSENSEVHSHKVIIKPIVKPSEECEQISTPKITIKPIEKPDNEAKVSPKITIKPVMRPVDFQAEVDDEFKERIVLKINKGSIPSKESDKANRETRKREHEDDKSEKLAKIKLKFSKGGDAHIVHEAEPGRHSPPIKRSHEGEGGEKIKRIRCDNPDDNSDEDVKIVEDRQSPIVISEDSRSQDSVILIEEGNDSVTPGEAKNPASPVAAAPVAHAPRKRGRPRKVPLVAREEFGNASKEEASPVAPSASGVGDAAPPPTPEAETTGRPKRSCRGQSVRDTLGIKPRKPKTPSKPRGSKRGVGARVISMKPVKEPKFSEGKIELIRKSLTQEAVQAAQIVSISKVVSTGLLEKILDRQDDPVKEPIELTGLLEAAKDQNIIEIIEVDSPSNSPKNIAIEEQHVEDIEAEILTEESIDKAVVASEVDNPKDSVEVQCSSNEVDSTRDDVDLAKDDADSNRDPSELGTVDIVVSDVEMQPPTPVFAPPLSDATAMDISQSTDIAMFEEETRMSADHSSRAQTPAKQVVSADVVVEESQSSVQSTATTESGKISRRSRLEVHQEADVSVLTADQLNEYYWGGNGPFMIQEQVAQFLGIKSFKRKYPAIPRRMVDMQERDYIRENGLASESMCDLGLTAVNSADILDIMYSDFQEKYEEFCKFQRDKQAKDLLNKQKALSQAASQERSKLDLVEQSVHSAAAFNANFNRARREQRKACMDLQTMNVHYPKGKMRQVSIPKMGNYPVAVVPGQFTDYYKEFTPTELNNLPLNTMLYTELHKILPEVSESDSDSSGSDSDDSSSSGSDSGSSCGDNCKLCSNHDKRGATPRKSPIHASV